MTDILSGIARTSQALCLLNATLLCRLARLSIFYFSLILCSVSLSHHLLLPYSARFALSPSVHGLKTICLMTVHFLFHPFRSPAVVRLEFPASASLPLCNVSQGSGHLSSHELRHLFLKQFGISVMLCNDSSANLAVKSDFRILYATT